MKMELACFLLQVDNIYDLLALMYDKLKFVFWCLSKTLCRDLRIHERKINKIVV